MERIAHNKPRTILAVYTHISDEMKSESNMLLIKLDLLSVINRKNATITYCM